MSLTINYNNIRVKYAWRLNGGGVIFAHEFVRLVARKIGKVDHVFEYCAGPGFIGFCLLAYNLCDKLTLADVNPKAVEAIQETIKANNLQGRVKVYSSDCLDDIPPGEQWDLVVSNPPWQLSSKKDKNIMVCDPEGRVHEKFFRDINKFLKPDGSILFIEGAEYTDVDSYKDMIENNGLRIAEVIRPGPFFGIFKNLDEYRGLGMPWAIFLRLCLSLREAYFIWVKKS